MILHEYTSQISLSKLFSGNGVACGLCRFFVMPVIEISHKVIFIYGVIAVYNQAINRDLR